MPHARVSYGVCGDQCFRGTLFVHQRQQLGVNRCLHLNERVERDIARGGVSQGCRTHSRRDYLLQGRHHLAPMIPARIPRTPRLLARVGRLQERGDSVLLRRQRRDARSSGRLRSAGNGERERGDREEPGAHGRSLDSVATHLAAIDRAP